MGEQGAYGSVRNQNAWEIHEWWKRGKETNIDKTESICVCSKEESAKLARNRGHNMNCGNVGIQVKDWTIDIEFTSRKKKIVTDENHFSMSELKVDKW